jgi:hypothetical protein
LHGVKLSLGPRIQDREGLVLLCEVRDVEVLLKDSTAVCTDGFLQLQCFLAPATLFSTPGGEMLLRVGARAGSDVGREDNFDGACDINVDEPLTVSPEVTFWCIPVLVDTPHV